jgi:DeoR family ulaG and ulaABCDEF operon transcriptional repressor
MLKVIVDMRQGITLHCGRRIAMHQRERHKIILAAVADRQFATVADLVELTEASAATIRRDIKELSLTGKIRSVHGGAESTLPPPQAKIASGRFASNLRMNIGQKRAIARKAVEMCEEGSLVVINGGSTTMQMAEFLALRQLHVLTNSIPLANSLIANSRATVSMPGGTVYREQQIVISPFENDGTQNLSAKRIFTSAYAISHRGILEKDPMLIQAEMKLLGICEEVVALIDSSKFRLAAEFVLAPLSRLTTVITDRGVRDEDMQMLEAAGIECIVVSEKPDEDAGVQAEIA